MNYIRRGLFGNFPREMGRINMEDAWGREFVDVVLREPPLWASWLAVALICLACVWLLTRKVRAYEVIK